MPRGHFRENLLGRTFGALRVVEVEPLTEKRRTYWWCLCVCGTRKRVAAQELKAGRTVSCGCLRGHARGDQLRTHGESYKGATSEYRIWCQMHGRCEQPGNPAYEYYGGRGISVCARWSGPEGYKHFIEDMGRRPSAKHRVERQNNDGNYEPNNCIWATQMVQAANTWSNHRITYNGETLRLAEWTRRTGLHQLTIRKRLKRGWSVERALTTPARPTGR